MISFIIIGRNEGWKLTKCIQSVFSTIKKNFLNDYEVIYVDSKSTDDSLKRAQSFKDIKIIKLTGAYNAAIARNIGYKESRGNVLFYIDGDMEILPDFLPYVYNEKEGLKHPFVSGQLMNYNYDEKGNFINNTWQYKEVTTGDKYYSTTGGIFLVNRELWEKVDGMDNRFRRGQELEMALRLAKRGYKILRKKEIIAYHHTVAYTHHSRMWRTIFSGDISFSNSFLLRKHILFSAVYVKLIKQYYTLVSFLFLLPISLIIQNFLFLYFYLIVVLIKTIRTKSKTFLRFFELYFFYIVRDASFIFYLFVPMKKIKASDIKYEIINDL